MIQAMMAEFFQLRVHAETKEMPVYALEVDKHRSKLTPHIGDERQFRTGYGSLIVKKGTVASLADWLSRSLWRPVVDRTGIAGEYDYRLEWTPDPGESGPESFGLPPVPPEAHHPATNAPSIFTAVREQLGLKLVAKKGPVQMIVIDSVAKPSKN